MSGPDTAAQDRSGQADIAYQALVTAATVGVARKGLAVSELGWPVVGYARILDAADPAAALLDAAALLTVARRAGVQPIRAAVPAHGAGAAPAGQDRELPTRAARLLRRIGQAELTPNYAAADTELLADLLTAARNAGYVVPAPLLPGLLDAAVRKKELRPVVTSVLGARGRWLAARRADWQRVTAAAMAERAPQASPEQVKARAERAAALLADTPVDDRSRVHAVATEVASIPAPWPAVLADAVIALLARSVSRPVLPPLPRALPGVAARCLPASGERDYSAELFRLANAYPQAWAMLLHSAAETVALRRAFFAELR